MMTASVFVHQSTARRIAKRRRDRRIDLLPHCEYLRVTVIKPMMGLSIDIFAIRKSPYRHRMPDNKLSDLSRLWLYFISFHPSHIFRRPSFIVHLPSSISPLPSSIALLPPSIIHPPSSLILPFQLSALSFELNCFRPQRAEGLSPRLSTRIY